MDTSVRSALPHVKPTGKFVAVEKNLVMEQKQTRNNGLVSGDLKEIGKTGQKMHRAFFSWPWYGDGCPSKNKGYLASQG